MAIKFRLIDRKNLGKDAAQNPRKLYAQAVNNGYVSLQELCEDISEYCSLTSADVKAVLDRMNYTLDKNLRAGRIVQFGEIGNFRMSVGSEGAIDEESFNTSLIRTPRIIFTPGKRLQTSRTNTGFEKDNPKVIEVECDKTHID